MIYTNTYEVDEHTLSVISDLKRCFGVKNNAQVICKTLCLAQIAAKYADKNGILSIISKNGEIVKIDLRN